MRPYRVNATQSTKKNSYISIFPAYELGEVEGKGERKREPVDEAKDFDFTKLLIDFMFKSTTLVESTRTGANFENIYRQLRNWVKTFSLQN